MTTRNSVLKTGLTPQAVYSMIGTHKSAIEMIHSKAIKRINEFYQKEFYDPLEKIKLLKTTIVVSLREFYKAIFFKFNSILAYFHQHICCWPFFSQGPALKPEPKEKKLRSVKSDETEKPEQHQNWDNNLYILIYNIFI